MFVLLMSVFLVALLFYLCVNLNRSNGVKGLTNWPVFGNMLGTFTQKEHFRDILQRAYNAFPDQRYFIFRNFRSPVVIIKDLDLIKQIMIRDFNYFEDHVGGVDVKIDPIFGNNLFSLKGRKWHEMRYTLSPAFTNSKIKEMLEYVEECADQMVNYYLEDTNNPVNEDKDFLEVEMKEAFTRYTNDVIASVAFGIRVNSLLDKHSEFYEMGRLAISQTRLKPEFTRMQVIKQIAMASFPEIAKHFRGPVFSMSVSSFFKDLIRTTMRTRKEQNIVRRDLVQLLMEAKSGLSRKLPYKEMENDSMRMTTEKDELYSGIAPVVQNEWNDDEITAQAMIFFISGFETSSTFLSFLAYELTKNPDVQKRLQMEIDETAEETDGKIEYTTLKDMKYMKMVVFECLRMWPTVISTDRRCNKTYQLPPPSGSTGKPTTLNPNDAIWIPIYGIHHDSKYYTDPEKFDPERFSEERMNEIKPFSYLPFGTGPRGCIGIRFALMETKIVIFKLLLHFDFIVTRKTQIPAKLKNNSFNLHCENGIWIGLRKRTQIN